jgi:hypothetical protein
VEYEALSYVWGDPSEGPNIKISGVAVRVTPNLHTALRRLRYPTKKRTVWIDQLCINQTDNLEKASQVSMMRDIYKRCTHCIIWLGELPEKYSGIPVSAAEAVFDFIRAVAAVETQPIVDLPILFEDSSDGEAARLAFRAFGIYSNPWWSRIWTVQEAIIPNAATLIWGHLSISREDVLNAARYLRHPEPERYFSRSGLFWTKRLRYTELLRLLFYAVRGFDRQNEEPLNLLMRWRHRQATDPRDKVYALLGLLEPAYRLPSAEACDYTIPAPTLFARVTVDLIQQNNGLIPLVGSSEIPQITPGLPTWAIDFAACSRLGQRQLKWWGHSHRYKHWHADAGRSFEFSASRDSRNLVLNGTWVDDVLEVCTPYLVAENKPIDPRALHSAIWSCIESVQRYKHTQGVSDPYISGGLYDTAIWKTLLGGLIMDEFPVGEAQHYHERWFDVLLDQLMEEQPNNPLYESLCGMLPNHAFFITKNGYVGIGSPQTTPGDQVWVLDGGSVPFVLRTVKRIPVCSEHSKLNLVGDAYVHGIMNGEAFSAGRQAQLVHLH